MVDEPGRARDSVLVADPINVTEAWLKEKISEHHKLGERG
jgi:hypothetical protein